MLEKKGSDITVILQHYLLHEYNNLQRVERMLLHYTSKSDQKQAWHSEYTYGG